MKLVRVGSQEWQRLCRRGQTRRKRIEESVRKIIENVRANGDDAVLRYTRKFDGAKLTAKQLRVPAREISAAYQNIDPNLVSHLREIIQNLERFYRKTHRKPWKTIGDDGVVLGEKYDPIEQVGIYIPAGTASLVSTVYMTVLPAKMAGVPRIALATPPRADGYIDPNILVVADLLGVKEIYKMGGAQAIAALAYGTKSVSPVDKICGPGNVYVAEAKRQVFGHVDIDLIAGPSEVAVIANHTVPASFVLADLLGESEHAGGTCILITPTKALAKLAKAQIPTGHCVLVKSLNEAVDVANQIAPEHLQLMVKTPQKLVKRVRNAGAIFLGPYSPVSVGDYVAGPSHVLPTGGAARSFSGLGLEDFMRRTHIISYSKKALEKAHEAIKQIAAIERLPRHYESVKVRLT